MTRFPRILGVVVGSLIAILHANWVVVGAVSHSERLLTNVAAMVAGIAVLVFAAKQLPSAARWIGWTWMVIGGLLFALLAALRVTEPGSIRPSDLMPIFVAVFTMGSGVIVQNSARPADQQWRLTQSASLGVRGLSQFVGSMSRRVFVRDGSVSVLRLVGVIAFLLVTTIGWDAYRARRTALLLYSSYLNQPRIARILIAFGADVNAMDSAGLTALQVAIQQGHVRMVEMLVDQGAAVDSRVPADAVTMAFTPPDAQGLPRPRWSRQERGATPLHLAVLGGRPEQRPAYDAIADLLIRHGANVNALLGDGYTPLHLVAGIGSDSTAKVLIDGGAEVNPVCGPTPLDVAESTGNARVVRLLVERGAIRSQPGELCRSSMVK